jgi:hypothetical protein
LCIQAPEPAPAPVAKKDEETKKEEPAAPVSKELVLPREESMLLLFISTPNLLESILIETFAYLFLSTYLSY